MLQNGILKKQTKITTKKLATASFYFQGKPEDYGEKVRRGRAIPERSSSIGRGTEIFAVTITGSSSAFTDARKSLHDSTKILLCGFNHSLLLLSCLSFRANLLRCALDLSSSSAWSIPHY